MNGLSKIMTDLIDDLVYMDRVLSGKCGDCGEQIPKHSRTCHALIESLSDAVGRGMPVRRILSIIKKGLTE